MTIQDQRTASPRGLTRRSFVKRFLGTAGSFYVIAGTGLLPSPRARAATIDPARFPQGVASGDPGPARVMLWTRAPGDDGAPVDLTAVVSRTPDFADVVAEREMRVTEASDYTARLLVDGLEPDTIYYYRFLSGDAASITGRTRTAPAPDADRQVNFAVISCQNYEEGFFGPGYRRLIADDEAADEANRIDFVLHLGDFIYESIGYKVPAGFADPDQERPAEKHTTLTNGDGSARRVPPFPSGGGEAKDGVRYAVTLGDYRHLYKTYLNDPALQAARARWPFICTWDDHEFSNDGWQSHDTYLGEGKPAQARKVAANQAWFEFIPAILDEAEDRAEAPKAARNFAPVAVTTTEGGGSENYADEPNNRAALASMTIYRALRYGRHVDLIITDTRSYRSDHPVPEPLAKEMANATRGALPTEIIALLDQGAGANGGNPPDTLTYQGKEFPNPRKDAEPGTMLGAEQKAWWKNAMRSSTATWKVWGNSVPALPLILNLSDLEGDLSDLVLTSDAWSGYPGERDELARFVAAPENNLANVVSLAGDHHMHFAGQLWEDYDSPRPTPAMTEFSITGMSSTAVFRSLPEITENNAVFERLAWFDPRRFDPAATKSFVHNFNMTLLYGVAAGYTAGTTGEIGYARAKRNPAHARHLSYIDSSASGYGIVRASADRLTADLVTIPTPLTEDPDRPAAVTYTARFEVPATAPGARPQLNGPVFDGDPPYPFV